jgi:nitrous oxide reductase accessory protein NosL
MVKNLLLIFPLSLILTAVSAGAHDRVEGPRSCQQCGMDRTAYSYSRMLILYTDGSQTGVCSLNCAANELKEHRGKRVKSIQVADYDLKKLIDARKATWVIGGSKRGVMTATPKWAFIDKGGAQQFIAATAADWRHSTRRWPWLGIDLDGLEPGRVRRVFVSIRVSIVTHLVCCRHLLHFPIISTVC